MREIFNFGFLIGEGGGRKTEDGRQRTEDRGQRTEGGGRKTEGRTRSRVPPRLRDALTRANDAREKRKIGGCVEKQANYVHYFLG